MGFCKTLLLKFIINLHLSSETGNKTIMQNYNFDVTSRLTIFLLNTKIKEFLN